MVVSHSCKATALRIYHCPSHLLSHQFWTVNEKPILYYTLECIEAIDWVEEIVVPVAEEKIGWIEAQLPTWKLQKSRFVIGGDARHRSIFAGLLCETDDEL